MKELICVGEALVPVISRGGGMNCFMIKRSGSCFGRIKSVLEVIA